MTLRLNGSTSGYVEIDAPATAGSNTLVLPTGNGSNGQYLQTNGSGALSWSTSGLPAQVLTLGTAVASTSGTSIDFTGIPSTVKRITVMFDGVSGSGASDLLFQLGDSGGIETTGYKGAATLTGTSSLTTKNFTSGFGAEWGGVTAKIWQGSISFMNLTGNTWVANGIFGRSDNPNAVSTAGSKTLSDVLTQVRITHVNGTDTFDAGSINILYEG